jgi:hypothetical protein
MMEGRCNIFVGGGIATGVGCARFYFRQAQRRRKRREGASTLHEDVVDYAGFGIRNS